MSTLFRKKAVLPKSDPLRSEENQQENSRCNRPAEQSAQREKCTSAAPPFPTSHRMIFRAAFIQNPICRRKQIGLGTAAPIIRPKQKVCLFKIWISGRSQNHRTNLNSFDHSFFVPFLFRIVMSSFRNRAKRREIHRTLLFRLFPFENGLVAIGPKLSANRKIHALRLYVYQFSANSGKKC